MTLWGSLRNLPKPVWILCVGAFINRSGNMVIPYLPLYFIKELKMDMATSSHILALFGFGGLLAGPISGWLSDRFGRIEIICGSLIAAAGILFGLSYIRDPFWMAPSIVLFAIMNEGFRPPLLASVADHSPPKSRKAAFVLVRVFINLGMSFGPAVGGFLAQWNYKYLFIANGTLTLLASLYLFWAYRRKVFVREVIDEEPEEPWSLKSLFKVMADRRMIYFSFAISPVMVVFFQHDSTFAIYINQLLKLPEYTFGLFFTLNTVLILIFEYWINMKTDHFKVSNLQAIGCLFSAVGFGVFAFAQIPFWVSIGIVIWSFGEMFLFPATTAYIDRISPRALRGTYMGWYGSLICLGHMIAPVLGLHVLETFGNTILWILMFAMGMASAVLFYFVKE